MARCVGPQVGLQFGEEQLIVRDACRNTLLILLLNYSPGLQPIFHSFVETLQHLAQRAGYQTYCNGDLPDSKC